MKNYRNLNSLENYTHIFSRQPSFQPTDDFTNILPVPQMNTLPSLFDLLGSSQPEPPMRKSDSRLSEAYTSQQHVNNNFTPPCNGLPMMTNSCSLLFLNQPVSQEEDQQAAPAEQLVVMDAQQLESGENSDNETV